MEVDAKIEADSREPKICEALQILGTKWAYLVMVELTRGAKRFNQLQRDTVIKTQSLTDILRQLEKLGMIRREVFPTVPVTVEYSLTEKGKAFQAVIREMDKWAEQWVEEKTT